MTSPVLVEDTSAGQPTRLSTDPTGVEAALARLADEVLRIPDVVLVAAREGSGPDAPMLYVAAPSALGTAAEQVIEAQCRLITENPGIELDIQIDGLEELGIEAADLDHWVPPGARILADHRGR